MTEFMLAYLFNIHIESNEEKRYKNITYYKHICIQYTVYLMPKVENLLPMC